MDKAERIWNVTPAQPAPAKPKQDAVRLAPTRAPRTRDAWICLVCAICVIAALCGAAPIIARAILR
jgi:hypothetical protein